MKQRQINALALTLLGLALVAASTACQKSGPGSSPTATMTAFFEAGRKKDPDGFKKTLSKGSLDLMESFAKAQNKTLDDALKSGMATPEAAEQSQTPAMRNEKITGDTATLEVQNEKNKEWETIPFVKEDGQWKIALDKALKDAREKFSSPQDIK
jgi:hypothetical protein